MTNLLRRHNSLSLTLAMPLLQAALAKASELEVRVSIAIVDVAGLLIHMAHMDGAPLQSRDIALNKAYTAASFGLPTDEWQQRLAKASANVREGLPLQPRMALFGGGKPITFDGELIGAIGVSGASEAVDTLCAKAATDLAVEFLNG